MGLTKEQRHEIYKRALDMHLLDKNLTTPVTPICVWLDWAQDELEMVDHRLTPTIVRYPELAPHKPPKKALYWWPRDPSDLNRERVLRDCIEKTKP